MGFLSTVSTVSAPRMRASAGDYASGFFSGAPMEWAGALSAAGITVTPDLAMTLSAMYSGVTTIGMDLATLPAQMFKTRDDGGKDRVRGYSSGAGAGGIGGLAYMLRWAPNDYQTATEFFLGMVAQYLLRNKAYAEIVSGPPNGFVQQLLPRHPDRVFAERLPSGRVRYRLTEADGTPRYVTQDEMFVVRDLAMDGINGLSRVQYGANAIGSALATQRAAGSFFKKGMTASTVATYTGTMEDEDEAALHKSISRYAAGVENSFGLLLIPDDVKISNLSVDPNKAQMMLAQEWGVREVARLLHLPGHKLGIADSVSYNSQVQAALDYVISCLRPIAIAFEQAIQRDLILAKDTYFTEFKLEALMRGDFSTQAAYLDLMIRNRTIRPSEARLILNMNPDPALDKLSEGDFQPGRSSAGSSTTPSPQPAQSALSQRATLKAVQAVYDNARRCLRRERVAVEKLAKRHASDVEGWASGLREFYADQAVFVARDMRMPIAAARAYAGQHGSAFETQGIVLIEGDAGEQWERYEAEELAMLSLDDYKEAA